jgi:threonyl-tRNA synthetase
MLQRIYGVMFPTGAELAEHLHNLEEAERRDHRRLGRELGLFFVDPIAPGSPFFLPKGATVYNLTTEFMRGLYKRFGYQEVITPQIFSTDLWKRSGHYDNYLENMYFIQDEDRELGVKPMNCPGHCMLYGAEVHSYRELPLRYADFGRLHRFERSGVLHGLTRVRSFSQDDAHIYCSIDQVGGEIASLVEMMRITYEAFQMGDPRFTLSLRPEKRIGNNETWDQAEDVLREALRSSGVDFVEIANEGAFYGPKIDLSWTTCWDVNGR